MSSRGVVSLGVPGDLLGEGEEESLGCSVYKIGGSPVVPPDAAEALRSQNELTSCQHCGQGLHLVTQVNCGNGEQRDDDGDYGTVTLLLVMVCANPSCAAAWKHWAALRVPSKPPKDEGEEEKEKECDANAGTSQGTTGREGRDDGGGVLGGSAADPFAPSDDWWNDTSWDDDAGGDGGAFGAGQAEEDAVVEALRMASLSCGKKSKPKTKSGGSSRRTRASPSVLVDSSPNAFPAFHLHFFAEPKASGRVSKLDARARELAAEYEAAEGKADAKGEGEGGAPESRRRGDDRGGAASGSTKDPASWTAEEYEAEPEHQKQLNKFLRRVEREPTQCVRWCRRSDGDGDDGGGGLLWPERKVPGEKVVPRCEACGGRRGPWAQVMGGSVAYISEAMEWAGRGPEEQAKLDPADFVTVAVYCCEADCRGDDPVTKEHCIVMAA